MTGTTSVITPARYTSGFTYENYMAQIKVNRDWFQRLYDGCQLTPQDAEFFKNAVQLPNGPAKMLVIGEDWCPDVYRSMPAMARIAEASGMEMRIFPRDENADIMDEFLNRGEHTSIPVAVFYTKDQEYIYHWIERPVLANEERPKIEEAVKKEMPDANEQEVRTEVRSRNQARFPAWQQEAIREMRQALTEKLGI